MVSIGKLDSSGISISINPPFIIKTNIALILYFFLFSFVFNRREIKSSGTIIPRFCHVGACHGEALFVFGGYSGLTRLNDFVRFDFAAYDLSFEVPSSSLISEFRALVDNETLSDVCFVVEGAQVVYAHKLMLMRCSYFRALILGEMKESKEETIRIEQVSHPIFLKILEVDLYFL